jgi:rubrerythrin
MEPLSRELQAGLMQEVARGSYAYVRNLAAAEQAVLRGQFNVAKVLRAAANAQRTIAFNTARILEGATVPNPTALLTTILTEQQPLGKRASASAIATPANAEAFLQQSETVHARVSDLVQRSLNSLADYPDILERDVQIFLYSCLSCGNPMEGRAREQCDLCGAIRAEFLYIGPFYSGTAERLGRLSPQQVLATLEAIPAQVAALIGNADDADLRRKPSETEWCIKEIVAHMLEADYICVGEVEAIMAQTPYLNTTAPWKSHLGKGYDELPAARLIELMTEARMATLALLQSLAPADWSKSYEIWGRVASVLDVGTWHANHDVGHLAQVKRLLAAWGA